jgi:flagellar biosynthesis/type III secretory pathway chaperone
VTGIDAEPPHLLVYEMLLAGFDLNEPYLKVLMDRFQALRYKNLHDKLAIDVEVSHLPSLRAISELRDARTLFGCMGSSTSTIF